MKNVIKIFALTLLTTYTFTACEPDTVSEELSLYEDFQEKFNGSFNRSGS